MDDVCYKFTSWILSKISRQQGGKVLLLDEVHKYEGWSREIKNSMMQGIENRFTGASILIFTSREAAMSRRSVQYTNSPDFLFRGNFQKHRQL
jgi:predicted AAA+ superfamily ATPase